MSPSTDFLKSKNSLLDSYLNKTIFLQQHKDFYCYTRICSMMLQNISPNLGIHYCQPFPSSSPPHARQPISEKSASLIFIIFHGCWSCQGFPHCSTFAAQSVQTWQEKRLEGQDKTKCWLFTLSFPLSSTSHASPALLLWHIISFPVSFPHSIFYYIISHLFPRPQKTAGWQFTISVRSQVQNRGDLHFIFTCRRLIFAVAFSLVSIEKSSL